MPIIWRFGFLQLNCSYHRVRGGSILWHLRHSLAEVCIHFLESFRSHAIFFDHVLNFHIMPLSWNAKHLQSLFLQLNHNHRRVRRALILPCPLQLQIQVFMHVVNGVTCNPRTKLFATRFDMSHHFLYLNSNSCVHDAFAQPSHLRVMQQQTPRKKLTNRILLGYVHPLHALPSVFFLLMLFLIFVWNFDVRAMHPVIV